MRGIEILVKIREKKSMPWISFGIMLGIGIVQTGIGVVLVLT